MHSHTCHVNILRNSIPYLPTPAPCKKMHADKDQAKPGVPQGRQPANHAAPEDSCQSMPRPLGNLLALVIGRPLFLACPAAALLLQGAITLGACGRYLWVRQNFFRQRSLPLLPRHAPCRMHTWLVMLCYGAQGGQRCLPLLPSHAPCQHTPQCVMLCCGPEIRL